MTARDRYEIRRGTVVLCCGPVPNLGYPAHILRQMYRDGLSLYRNGKRVKLCDIVA